MVSGPGCGGVGWVVVGDGVVVVTLSRSEDISGNGSDVNSSSIFAVVSVVVVVIIAMQERRSVRYRNDDDGILRLLCVIFLISIKILSLLGVPPTLHFQAIQLLLNSISKDCYFCFYYTMCTVDGDSHLTGLPSI